MDVPRIGLLGPGLSHHQQSVPFTVVSDTPDDSADYWVIVEEGAALLPDFVAQVSGCLTDRPARVCLYPDLVGPEGPVSVGGWSPERARWQDYTGPVLVVSSDLLGGSVPGDPAGLRREVLRAADDVRHLPVPLVAVVEDVVEQLDPPVRPAVPQQLRVSLVIPTRGSKSRVRGRRVRMIDHLLARLSAEVGDAWVDVVLVIDSDADLTFADRWLARRPGQVTVVTTPVPFNFSRKVNAGVDAARGDVIVLLNDDIEPITPTWLPDLVAVALEPEVGVVGPLLLHEDGSVQHRGHAFSPQGVHLVDSGADPELAGPRDRNKCDRDVTGVTGACMVVRRDVWDAVGGFDPAFPVAFNDVDFCERARRAGYRVVLCNSVRLFHFESRTRPGHATDADVRLLRRRWAESFSAPDPLTPDIPDPMTPPVSPRRLRLRAAWRSRSPFAVARALWPGSR